MKIAVIGGGSSYTPELLGGLLARAGTLALDEVWLMDVDAGRLEVVGGLAQRMAAARRAPFALHLTADRRAALRDAAYVIVQLRVGGMAARREDEYLGRRHGLIGQETTGVGGLAKALRTIPVVLDIARDVAELAPGALLINFTNPAGLLVEALARHAPQVASVGVCNVPVNAQVEIVEGLAAARGVELDPDRGELDSLGLNHLSWHRGFWFDGVDVWPEVLAGYLARLRAEPEPEWAPRTVEVLGMIPNYYLHYYYHTGRRLAAQAAWPPSRAEEVMAIEAELLARYAEPDRTEPPPSLSQRGGAHYSTAATQLIESHHTGRGDRQILNVPHRGAVAGWPGDWVLEMPCRVEGGRIVPLPAEPLPPVCFGLLAQVKTYEILAVEAAVRGDRAAAHRALLAHPLGPEADRVQAVLDDLLETNRRFLPWLEA
jgi:6-phospho-beta-glucosidase